MTVAGGLKLLGAIIALGSFGNAILQPRGADRLTDVIMFALGAGLFLWGCGRSGVIATGVRGYLWGSQAFKAKKIFHSIFIALVAGVSAIAAFLAVQYAQKASARSAAVERSMAQFRETPLVGIMLKQVPGFAEQLKATLNDDISNGRNGSRELVKRISKETAWPSVRVAQDTYVLSIWASQRELIHRLQRTNRAACREFVTTGIQDVNKLDPVGRQLFSKQLRAFELAYLDGRGKSQAEVLPGDLVPAAAEAMGLSSTDLQAMSAPESACDAGVKFYTGIDRLKPEYQARVARYFLIAASE